MKSKNAAYVKVCPKCGSTNISLQGSGVKGEIINFCKECDYHAWGSGFFPEMTREAAKQYKNKKTPIP